MATVLQCDGCGKTQGESESFWTFGITETREYCAKCRDSVEDYLVQRDDLHTTTARDFTEDLEAMIALWHFEHPKGQLPDFRKPGAG